MAERAPGARSRRALIRAWRQGREQKRCHGRVGEKGLEQGGQAQVEWDWVGGAAGGGGSSSGSSQKVVAM